MSDSHGRFRVKKGEVEIEYEGLNFVQEYRAALVYLNIVGGAKTGPEERGVEASPNRVVRPQTASHPAVSPVPSHSGLHGPKMESVLQGSELRLGSPSPNLQEAKNLPIATEEAKSSLDMMFDAIGRTNQRTEAETEQQDTEPSKETNPMFGNKPHNGKGAIPNEKLNDDKFKDVLKKMGLAT